jgi:Kef-type K+ transport system membrane component KefB/voltage-gated potassium channel Kch
MHSLLNDIGIAILAATLLGLIAHWLRQPIILGYLIAGALVGPQVGFGWVHEAESIETISEIGLVLLLFVIGLEMNLKELAASGRQLLVAGFGQFLGCALLGAAVFGALGYGFGGSSSEGLYLALLCGLSSTAIVVKLLYDKGELDTLPGRLTLGILVIQDIYAIFILAFQPNFADPAVGPILRAVVATVGLVVGGFLLSKYVLRRIFLSIAMAPEMVLAVSAGWCVAVAAAATALGLSKEMGALIAGVSISAFPYSIHVTAKTLPLRDFFLTLFFMSLGMKIIAPTWGLVLPVLGISAFVVVSRFLTVYPLVVLSGGGRRAAFVSSINLAQISEFSLVIASLGVGFGHIGQETVAKIIYAMALTAVLSSYGIRYSHQLYLAFDRLLARGRPRPATEQTAASGEGAPGIAILGYHRGARAVVEAIARSHPNLLSRILVVDFNPVVLEELRARGIRGTFGDISSLETLQHAHLGHARVILSTIPDLLLRGIDNLGLVRACRAVAPHAAIVATANDERHEQRLRSEGATFVVRPFDLVGECLAQYVSGVVTSPSDPPLVGHEPGA